MTKINGRTYATSEFVAWIKKQESEKKFKYFDISNCALCQFAKEYLDTDTAKAGSEDVDTPKGTLFISKRLGIIMSKALDDNDEFTAKQLKRVFKRKGF